MDENRFNDIVQRLSNHFELFFSVVVVMTIFFVVLFLSLKLKEISLKDIFRSAIRYILFMTIVVGQITLISIVGYLFWLNYQKPALRFQFPEDILSNTHWVKDNLRIYFIDGRHLRSIRVNGRDQRDVLTADEFIKEYHFSPDGKHLLVVAGQKLYSVDLENWRSVLIDSVGGLESSGDLKGVLSGIRWAPDSRHFCYEIARWSRYSSQDRLYVYDIENGEKRAIQSPARRISSLYWDRSSGNLYYLRHEAKDTSVHTYAFDVHVFRIPLATLVPESVAEIPSERSSVPIENLNIRGIDLFLDADQLSFTQAPIPQSLVSEKGSALGIDEDDNLYFVAQNWFRKRLCKIPREPVLSDMSRYQYKGGDLVVKQIRWIPGGRYVIMQHRYLGVLILEPVTGKIGLLIEADGHTFGWYKDIRQIHRPIGFPFSNTDF